MRNHSVRRAALIAMLTLSTSCSDSRLPTPPTAPTVVPVAPNAPVGPVRDPTPFPGPGTYVFASSPRVAVQWYTAASRFILSSDGTFVLEYPHVSYRGRYTEAGGVISFAWDGWSVAGPWGATGVSAGNSLIVSYNLIMEMSDFEGGEYVRIPK